MRRPSEFSNTTGSPPSMTAMQEFVVPKSMPSTFAIKSLDTLQLQIVKQSQCRRRLITRRHLWHNDLRIKYGQIKQGCICATRDAMAHRCAPLAHCEWLNSKKSKGDYLLPGLIAGMAARSEGRSSGAKVSTCRAIRLNSGTPKSTVPFERSTRMAMPATSPPWARTISRVS